jgi:hypothetical protein
MTGRNRLVSAAVAVDIAEAGAYLDPIIIRGNAQVAELVDAQVSGTCGSNVVEVRVFSWAPSGRAE